MPDSKAIKNSVGHQVVTLVTYVVLASGAYAAGFFTYVANTYIEESEPVMENTRRVDSLYNVILPYYEAIVLANEKHRITHEVRMDVLSDVCIGGMDNKDWGCDLRVTHNGSAYYVEGSRIYKTRFDMNNQSYRILDYGNQERPCK